MDKFSSLYIELTVYDPNACYVIYEQEKGYIDGEVLRVHDSISRPETSDAIVNMLNHPAQYTQDDWIKVSIMGKVEIKPEWSSVLLSLFAPAPAKSMKP